MTEELANTVYAWVKAGGVLFCTGGPAGIWDEYGQPSGRLDNIFGGVWTNAAGHWELAGVDAFHESGGVKAWHADYGKGAVIVFDNMNKHMFELMPSYVEKRFGGDNPMIQYCMREQDGVKYLYVLNWSVDRAEDVAVFLEGHFGAVVDEGLQLPMKVPHYEKDGKTFFRTRLAPAAITLFCIKP